MMTSGSHQKWLKGVHVVDKPTKAEKPMGVAI